MERVLLDEEDFKLLIGENLGMWQRTALRVTRNAADADEAVQLALISAWRSRNSFRSEAKAASWVCRIAINHAYNLIRSRERRKGREQVFISDFLTGPEDESEKMEVLFLAIGDLPEPYRSTVTVGIAHNFRAEICVKYLGCSAGAFHGRMHKAKKLLKKRIGGLL